MPWIQETEGNYSCPSSDHDPIEFQREKAELLIFISCALFSASICTLSALM